MNHPTEYKTFTIELDMSHRYPVGIQYLYYPTKEGMQHDIDSDENGYRYTGNCKWADSIDEAKWEIDSIVPFFVETTIQLGGFKLRNITKFEWLSDAVKFATRFNGELSVQFTNP